MSGRWKPLSVVVAVTKHHRVEGWDWKKPFLQLKESTIVAEEAWKILLQTNEDELGTIYKFCDGRHQVETLLEEVEEKPPELEEEIDPAVAGAEES